MENRSLAPLLHYLRCLSARLDGAASVEDGELLRRYVAHGDETSFAALVHRHGPMVWGVCVRLLARTQDAEDAFQATFLVLVRKARTLRWPGLLGPWLYGVAQRTAFKARALRCRRAAREQPADDNLAATVADAARRELASILDEEVNRLPERYRQPFVLCHVQGLTNEEAARRLGCARGTIFSRLARARLLLQKRLARRGVELSGGLLTALLAQTTATASVPTVLLGTTVQSCLAFAAGATSSLTAPIIFLTQGVLRGMLLTPLKMTVALVLILGVVGSGVGVLSHYKFANAADPAPPNDKPALAQKSGPSADSRPQEKSNPLGEDRKSASKTKKTAKPKKTLSPPTPPAAPPRDYAQHLHDTLANMVDYEGLEDPRTTLVEALDQLAKRYNVSFNIDEVAFKFEGVPEVARTIITEAAPIPPMKSVTLATVLKKILNRIPVPSGADYLIRNDGIEITTGVFLHARLRIPSPRSINPEDDVSMLTLTKTTLIWENFDHLSLAVALERLAKDMERTYFNLVLDPRVEDQLKQIITCRLANVPLDTAVDLLANMAGLDVVQMDNVIYITTPKNAASLRAKHEQNDETPLKAAKKDKPKKPS